MGKKRGGKTPIYRHRPVHPYRRIRVDKKSRAKVKQGNQWGIFKGFEINGQDQIPLQKTWHAGIKGVIYGKTHRLLMCQDPQKSKNPSLKKWPKRRDVAPQSQPPTSPESMHPKFSSLSAFMGEHIACSKRTRVLQLLKATTRLGAIVVWCMTQR